MDLGRANLEKTVVQRDDVPVIIHRNMVSIGLSANGRTGECRHHGSSHKFESRQVNTSDVDGHHLYLIVGDAFGSDRVLGSRLELQ